MHSLVRVEASALLLLLAWCAPQGAHAAEAAPIVVWYRASDECPGGSAFLEKLPKRAAGARLAEPGDHIDFLVTLLAGRGETVGRLERQTQSATVAIRELRDTSCSHVADAIALSLALALDPAARAGAAPPASEETPGTEAVPSEPPRKANAAPTPPPSLAPPPPERRDVVGERTPTAPQANASNGWSLVLAGGVLAGAMPAPLVRGSVLAEITGVSHATLPDLSLLFGVTGAAGSTSTDVGAVQRWIAAGRGEACPFRWAYASFGLVPCVAIELGATGASASRQTSRHDAGLWAAPGVALRGSLKVAGPVALEVSADALVPLVRNAVYAGPELLYRGEIAVFHVDAGVSVRLR